MVRAVVVIVIGWVSACGGAPARAPDAAPPEPGAARVEWRIVDGARDPCSCQEVGAGVVRVIARPSAPLRTGPIYEDGFECLQALAVTAPLAAGRYDLELRLETDDGVVLGGARTSGVIGGALVDLGTVELAVGG